MKDNCVILVTNKAYIDRCLSTINQLRNIGKYNGDIIVIIGDDLKNEITNYQIDGIIKYFPDYDRSDVLNILNEKKRLDPIKFDNIFIMYKKTFQYHKIHCFDEYFKQWKKCFYIDVGMMIHKPINKFFEIDCTNLLLANSDAQPTYEWKLGVQFDKYYFPELYEELSKNYELDIDYFQSTIMLYDTNIIESNTKDRLWELSCKYINSRTNDQSIMNLYFNCEKKLWNQIQLKDEETYYYDFWEREGKVTNDYIMTKRKRW